MIRQRLNAYRFFSGLAMIACGAVCLVLCQSALAAPKKSAKAAAPAAGDENLPSLVDSPAIASIRESNPTQPVPLVRAVNSLVVLGDVPLAKIYVKRLIELHLSQKQLAALGEEVGTDPLISMVATKSLGSEAAEFAKSVLDAVRKAQTNPRRIARLIEELKSSSDAERAAARIDLTQAGDASIAPLVRVLADPGEKDIHAQARTLLVGLGPQAVEPLLAVFDSAPSKVKAQVGAVLFHMSDPRALDALLAASVAPGTDPQVQRIAAAAVQQALGASPSRLEVGQRLERRAMDYLNGTRPLPSDNNDQVQMWTWDRRRAEFVTSTWPQRVATTIKAALLARLLHDVVPESAARAEQLHLLADLQLAKLQTGLRQPLKPGQDVFERAAESVPAAERALQRAMAERYIPAAIALTEVLGASREVGQLARGGAVPSPLVQAAEDSDRRVRYAALEAIVKLGATQPFTGSSVVTRSLAHFANFDGRRRAAVADPRPERAHQLGALLEQAGFATDVATTGRDLFHAAGASPEVEFAMIVLTVEKPAAEEVIRQLRRDPRTASLPVGLIANPEDLYRAEGLTMNDPLVKVFVRPRDVKTMAERADSLAALQSVNFVPHAERLDEAAAALTILKRLADHPQVHYDLTGMDAIVNRALYVPQLTSQAISILGALGTPLAQRTLVNLASTGTQPIENRRAAAAAFANSLKRHGIRLTIAEIQQQAHLYDISSAQDKQTQEVLWSVLDSLQSVKKEGRRSEVGGRKEKS